eukprot:symbB.v1.2.033211.t1/scaffold4089.1/size46570/4
MASQTMPYSSSRSAKLKYWRMIQTLDLSDLLIFHHHILMPQEVECLSFDHGFAKVEWTLEYKLSLMWSYPI